MNNLDDVLALRLAHIQWIKKCPCSCESCRELREALEKIRKEEKVERNG